MAQLRMTVMGPLAGFRTCGKLRDVVCPPSAKGSDRIECEVCLERCPFDVDIIGKMHRAAEVFEKVA